MNRKDFVAAIDEIIRLGRAEQYKVGTRVYIPNQYPRIWESNSEDIRGIYGTFGFGVEDQANQTFVLIAL